jgi:hypothetical protein
VYSQRDWLGGLDGAADGQNPSISLRVAGVAVQVAVLAGDAEGFAVSFTLSRDTP